MKFTRASGMYAAGLLCLTVQILIFTFKYVIEALGFAEYIVNNGASVAGLVLLATLFVRRREIGLDVVLTVIGILLWVVQFVQVFRRDSVEVIDCIITCSVGFVGVLLVLLGLVLEVIADKNKHNT